jgi:hypothetical protein
LNSHKLNLNQFSDNYHVIAIHSDLEEFRLAFFLNQKLDINLKRKRKDISLIEIKANYSVFEYLNEAMYLNWIFFSNKSLMSNKITNEESGLFGQESFFQNEVSLIKNPKGVDYFLIIENVKNKTYVKKVLKKISEIRGVITSFMSEKKLENKENLIFS